MHGWNWNRVLTLLTDIQWNARCMLSVLILKSISHIDFLQSRLSLLLSLCHCKVPCHCPALCGMAEHKLLRRCPPLFNSRENGMLLWQDAFYSLPQQNGAFECPSSRIHLRGILASSIHVYASIKLTGKIMKFSLVLHFLTQKGGRTKQEEGNVRRSIWSESEPISQTNFCNAIGSFVSIAAAPRHEKNLLSLLKQSQL